MNRSLSAIMHDFDFTPPPQPAFVYLHGGVDDEVVHQLMAIGYPIRGVVLANDDAGQGVSVPAPIIDHRTARQQLGKGEVPDLIVAAAVADEPTAAMAAYFAADRFAPARTRLLHPAATIPYFRVTYPGNFACIGFPGVGNIVVQAVLTRIQELHDLRHDGPFEPFCARLARNHGFFLRGFVDDALARWAPFETAFGQSASDRASVRIARPDGSYVAVLELPYCSYIGTNFGGHTFVTPRIKALLDTFAFRWFAVARDPLRVIVSNAAKVRRPPTIALNNVEWLESICVSLRQHAENAQDFGPDVLSVRYEDLLARPVETIQTCGRHLSMPVSREQAAAIWADVGFVPLTPAGPQHLNDPKAERTKHLSQDILANLQRFGIRDCCEMLGYEWLDSAVIPATADTGPDTGLHVSPLYGYMDLGSNDHASPTGVICTGSDPEWTDKVTARLQASRYRRFYGMLGPLTDEELANPQNPEPPSVQ
jgi:hypothetical protein